MVTAEDQQASTEAASASTERLRRLLLGSVALGFLVLVVLSGSSLWLVGRDQDYTKWVNHTYTVERHLSRLGVLFERAEAARRGYLLTREPGYLGAYQQAVTELPRRLEAVSTLTADNPRQRENAASMQGLLSRTLDTVGASLRHTQSQAAQVGNAQDAGASAQAAPNVGAILAADQQTAENIRTVLARMLGEEDRLLGERAERQGQNEESLLVLVLVSGLVLASLGLVSLLLVRRYATDLSGSQASLRRLNEGLELRVHERTADLTRANEEIQRFAYIVSHDLRSPLVNVMGFTSELEVSMAALQTMMVEVHAKAPELVSREAEAALATEMPEAVGFIRSSTKKMDRLINAILRLSREGRRTLTPERIDMVAMVQGIAASLQHQATERGAEIVIEPHLPDIVGDRLGIEQVFSNLVENALKYLKPGRPGRVGVRGSEVADRLVYEIQDNGRGIDPKDHERIFDLFRRAGPQDQPGEGIGLAHVRALVQRFGGSIMLESALDEGSTFRLSLPRTFVSSQEVSA